MVAVEGHPAQRSLGEIARAHHQPARGIADIHENLRAFARLGVFVGYAEIVWIMADVAKVLRNGGGDVDLAQGDAQVIGQRFGVAARARGCAEARHGNGDDALQRQREYVEGVYGHQQGQR